MGARGELRGRVGVVTGGGRGIGRGVVRELGRCGMRVVVNYRSDAEAAAVSCAGAMEVGAELAVAIQADVSDLVAGKGLVGEVIERLGRIDLWVHNAGIAPAERRDVLETTLESWERVLGTNLRGPYFLTQEVVRAMRADGAGAETDRQIHFITSVSSEFVSVNRGEYCVAKAGLSMVAKLFAARLAEEGIRVFEIRPGLIRTEMTAGVEAAYQGRIETGQLPMIRRWGEAEDVGRVVASLACGGLPYATGNVIEVDGGMHVRRL